MIRFANGIIESWKGCKFNVGARIPAIINQTQAPEPLHLLCTAKLHFSSWWHQQMKKHRICVKNINILSRSVFTRCFLSQNYITFVPAIEKHRYSLRCRAANMYSVLNSISIHRRLCCLKTESFHALQLMLTNLSVLCSHNLEENQRHGGCLPL